MTVHHHPTDETLAAHAAGALDIGRSLVVEAHLEACPRCRCWVGSLHAVGGLMLADIKPMALSPGALDRTLAALPAQVPVQSPPRPRAATAEAITLPRILEGRRIGEWKWLGPGIHRCDIEVPDADGARVFLLRAAPGTRMPHHTHTGSELTLVLSGAFAHEGGTYRAGDFDEADDDVEHQPVVRPGATCVCLVAMTGDLRLVGWLGRVLQPFVRI
ncbi:MAG: ChrR family anti-sigma-E factor [Hyphomicrobiaceae bacterium]|nr:ChrR family anti-sigma-E factor [Hyphomicrobiaceae bacterium]